MNALLETFKQSIGRWRVLREMRVHDDAADEGYEAYFNEQISVAKEALGVGDRKRALAIWNQMRARFPELCGRSKAASSLLLDLGLFDDAEAVLRAGEKRYPDNPQFALGLIELDRRRGKGGAALKRCEALQRKFPHNADAYVITASCLATLGQLLEADAILKRAAERFPDQSEVLVEYARVAERRQEWQEAVRRWEVVKARFDNPAAALGLAPCLRSAGRLAEAEEILTGICLRFPGNHWAFMELARIAEVRGDYLAATENWERVRRHGPFLATGYLAGADAARRAGQEAEVDQILAEAVTRLNSNLEVHLEYARNSEARADWATASERWALVLERFPDCVEARHKVAEARMKATSSNEGLSAGERC